MDLKLIAMKDDKKISLVWSGNDAKKGEHVPQGWIVSLSNNVQLKVAEWTGYIENRDEMDANELFLTSLSVSQIEIYVKLCTENGLKVLSCRGEAFFNIGSGENTTSRILIKPQIAFDNIENEGSRALAVHLIHEAREECRLIGLLNCSVDVEPQFIWL